MVTTYKFTQGKQLFCVRATDTKYFDKKVFLITFITLILLMLSRKEIKNLFNFICHYILHNPHNLNILFSLFHILYKSRPHKWPNVLTFPYTFLRQCICLHFFAICNRNIHICLLLLDKLCNCQGKGIWLWFHLRHGRKRDMFPHNHRSTL